MLIQLRCDCGNAARAEVNNPADQIDARARAMGAVAARGWRYRNGRIGKTTVSMICPVCLAKEGPPLKLDADFAPADVIPTNDDQTEEPHE